MSKPNVIIRGHNLSLVHLGAAFMVLFLLAGALLFEKDRIGTMLTPGENIGVMVEDKIGLREYISEVKVAGVPVGKVSSIERITDDLTRLTVKVDSDIPAKLGTAPSAEVRPTTLLGGNYYVDLRPGGLPGVFEGTIPVERTSDAVELDDVVGALQPNARRGIQTAVRDLDGTLGNGGSAAIRDLTRDAPRALDPAGEVLAGLRGTRPRTDLPELVRGAESVGRVLSEVRGQLGSSVAGLKETSDVLARRSGDLATALRAMPATLESTDAGLKRLDATLRKLRDTARPVRPVVGELDGLLEELDPVLVEARPVVNDLRTVLSDAKPLVRDLVPASRRLTGTFEDLRGPVLNRVNGPILDTVHSKFQGSGPYAATRGIRPLYQELGYMISNMDRVAEMTDRNGAMVAFEVGLGPGTVAGLPISLEQLFNNLAGYRESGR